MDLSGAFGRAVALVGDAVIMLRHREGGSQAQAVGGSPAIPAAKPQGGIPTLKMPTARGWAPGTTPVADTPRVTPIRRVVLDVVR